MYIYTVVHISAVLYCRIERSNINEGVHIISKERSNIYSLYNNISSNNLTQRIHVFVLPVEYFIGKLCLFPLYSYAQSNR